MQNHPFIGSSLTIYDQHNCTVSPVCISGQPAFVTSDQNRKIYDNLTTSITSPQPTCQPINFCFCEPQPNILQAQKSLLQGGEAVLFDFKPKNIVCVTPQNFQYTPPCPQIINCPNKNSSPCWNFGKYGLEALQFQEKVRESLKNGFTYDKTTNTENKPCFCCNSPKLQAEFKQQLFTGICDGPNNKTLKVHIKEYPETTKGCCCFPKPDPDKFGSAKTLILGERKEYCCTEILHKDYDIVNEAKQEALIEMGIKCDCIDKWKNNTEKSSPSCLKKSNQNTQTTIKKKKKVCYCLTPKDSSGSTSNENVSTSSRDALKFKKKSCLRKSS